MIQRLPAVILATVVVAAAASCSGGHSVGGMATSEAAKAPAQSVWIGHAEHHWQQMPTNPGEGAAPADGLGPGDHLVQTLSDGGTETCTAGAVFVDAAGSPFVASAGHCDRERGRPVAVEGSPTQIGTFTGTVGGEIPGLGADTTLLALAPGQQLAPDAGVIAGRWPVIGVMSASEVQLLPDGTSVCLMTGSAGVRCGGRAYADEETFVLRFDGFAPIQSDSGSAAFLVSAEGGAVLLGGADAALSDSRTDVSYYEWLVRSGHLHPVTKG